MPLYQTYWARTDTEMKVERENQRGREDGSREGRKGRLVEMLAMAIRGLSRPPRLCPLRDENRNWKREGEMDGRESGRKAIGGLPRLWTIEINPMVSRSRNRGNRIVILCFNPMLWVPKSVLFDRTTSVIRDVCAALLLQFFYGQNVQNLLS